jgi:hypothetical protein
VTGGTLHTVSKMTKSKKNPAAVALIGPDCGVVLRIILPFQV